MSKLSFALISLVILFGGMSEKPDLSSKIDHDREYIESIMSPYNVSHKKRIMDCIQFYSYRYDIPITIFTRLIEVESGFCHWKVNSYSGCVGLCQVSPDWWSHLMYSVCDKRYAKYLHKTGNVTQILGYIEANINAGAIIIDDYRKRYGGYSNVLHVYGGFRAKKYRHRTNQAREYINKVMRDYE